MVPVSVATTSTPRFVSDLVLVTTIGIRYAVEAASAALVLVAPVVGRAHQVPENRSASARPDTPASVASESRVLKLSAITAPGGPRRCT
jgi:hypothetical protein